MVQDIPRNLPVGGDAPELIPFSAATYNKAESPKKVFHLHNKTLTDDELIRVDNLRGLDEKLLTLDHTQEPTLRSSILSQRLRTDPATPLFFSVSQ